MALGWRCGGGRWDDQQEIAQERRLIARKISGASA
jgi:hypothetical protein